MVVDVVPGTLITARHSQPRRMCGYAQPSMKAVVIVSLQPNDLLLCVGHVGPDSWWSLFLSPQGIPCWILDPLLEIVS